MNQKKEIEDLLLTLGKQDFLDFSSNKLLIFLGSLGDLESFEYIQYLKNLQSKTKLSSSNFCIIAIGSNNAKEYFCRYTGINTKYLYTINDSFYHDRLKLSPGLTRTFSPLLNLIIMCIGIGSPGTIKEVLRGYWGDRKASQIFEEAEQIKFGILPQFSASLFNYAGGKGFQRPFELASLRLLNMIEIFKNFSIYYPDIKFMTQRGGTFILDNNNSIIYKYEPISLMNYLPEDKTPWSICKEFLE